MNQPAKAQPIQKLITFKQAQFTRAVFIPGGGRVDYLSSTHGFDVTWNGKEARLEVRNPNLPSLVSYIPFHFCEYVMVEE